MSLGIISLGKIGKRCGSDSFVVGSGRGKGIPGEINKELENVQHKNVFLSKNNFQNV